MNIMEVSCLTCILSSCFQAKICWRINATVKLTKIDEKSVRTVLQGYKIHNCDLMIREDVRASKDSAESFHEFAIYLDLY